MYKISLRPLSPIERMIDKACGFDPADLILLRCPVCLTEKPVRRDDIDPPNAAVVEFPCKACRTDSDEVSYYDPEGEEIPFP